LESNSVTIKTSRALSSRSESLPGKQNGVGRVFKIIPLPWWALVVLIAATAFVSPYLLIPQNLAYLIRQAVPGAMMAMGEAFVIIAGGFDLSIGSTVSLIAALASGEMNANPDNILYAVALCLAVGTAIGLVNGFIVTKLKVPSFLTTLGMMILLQGIALVYTGGIPKGGFPDQFRAFGLGQVMRVPNLIWIMVFFAVFSQLFIRRTGIGRQVLAVGGNDLACHLMGVHVDRIRIFTFVISSLFTTIGTLLMVTTFRVWDSTIGQGMELETIAMVIVGGAAIGGGRGSMITTLLGWAVMTMLFTFLNVIGFPQAGRLLVQGAVILLAVAANREALLKVK
jgi:ribose transport system permease protein